MADFVWTLDGVLFRARMAKGWGWQGGEHGSRLGGSEPQTPQRDVCGSLTLAGIPAPFMVAAGALVALTLA